MTPKFSDETAISNCAICVLATAMRDCPRCAFNAGLVTKGLRLLKAQQENAPMPTREKDAAWWCELIARAQEHLDWLDMKATQEAARF